MNEEQKEQIKNLKEITNVKLEYLEKRLIDQRSTFWRVLSLLSLLASLAGIIFYFNFDNEKEQVRIQLATSKEELKEIETELRNETAEVLGKGVRKSDMMAFTFDGKPLENADVSATFDSGTQKIKFEIILRNEGNGPASNLCTIFYSATPIHLAIGGKSSDEQSFDYQSSACEDDLTHSNYFPVKMSETYDFLYKLKNTWVPAGRYPVMLKIFSEDNEEPKKIYFYVVFNS